MNKRLKKAQEDFREAFGQALVDQFLLGTGIVRITRDGERTRFERVDPQTVSFRELEECQRRLECEADRLLEYARCWQQRKRFWYPRPVKGWTDYFDGLREIVPLDENGWDVWASAALSEASWLSGQELESVR